MYIKTNSAPKAETSNIEAVIPSSASASNQLLVSSDKGVANGIAELDTNGSIPSSQLPSYVDDVLEYASTSAFPATGTTSKIYVALDTNKTYRWGGSEYVEISESLAIGTTSSTAFAGDRGLAIENKIPTSASASNKLATASDIPTTLPASDVYSWAKASSKPSYAYSEISNTPTLGTIASRNFTAISHSVSYKLTVKNTEYTVISEWNPPANGFMFMFVNQSFSNARPSYIRVEKYLDAGGNGNKWIPVAIADQQTDAVGITGIQLPVIDYVSTTNKYRVICKQSQWDSMTGNNTIALNGFVIS